VNAFGFEEPEMAELRHHEQCNKAIWIMSIDNRALTGKPFIFKVF
jgi:hypothetical protein